MSCYVIHSQHTYYTTRHTISKRPCVIAFKRYRNALQLVEYLCNVERFSNRPRIQEIPEQLLKTKCYKTCLDVYLYEDANMLYKSIETPDQDYVKWLQKAYNFNIDL